MKGPLHSGIYDTSRPVPSWWEASAPADRDRPPLASDTQAEVAIIGGGYAGLSAAARLAERGVDALVLDAGPIGWGASGRNGGIVGIGSHKLSDAALLRRYGEAEVARYIGEHVENLHRIRAFCLEAGLGDQVSGEGELILAHSPAFARRLAGWRGAHGVTIEPVPPETRADIRALGGVRITPGFGIHPLRLVRALADRAETLGARVHPCSEVRVWERDGPAHRLVTAGGSVRAAKVLVATNGFTPDDLTPRLTGRAVPALSNIGVTRVLTDDERAGLSWLGPDPVCDSRNLLSYLRLLPEGRLLLGMRGDLFGTESGARRMRQAVAERIALLFPGLAGIGIDYFWRGPICATAKFTPSVGLLPDDPTVAFAFGWHGSGINGAQAGGRWIADVLAGDPESRIPAPCRGLGARLPLPGLRPLYVGAMHRWYWLKDRFG